MLSWAKELRYEFNEKEKALTKVSVKKASQAAPTLIQLIALLLLLCVTWVILLGMMMSVLIFLALSGNHPIHHKNLNMTHLLPRFVSYLQMLTLTRDTDHCRYATVGEPIVLQSPIVKIIQMQAYPC